MSRVSSEHNRKLRPGFSPLGIWAVSIGASIGWGSFIVTCNTYLQKSGILGTVFGLLVGMAVILVITWNLQYMIINSPDAGGIYTFAKKVCGNDYGFLAAWFVLLTYLAILWANITSVPLFARYFLGDVFRFGFHYTIFGYEVFLGEALLSILVMGLTCFICVKSRTVPINAVTVFSLVFAAGFTLTAIIAMMKHGSSGYEYRPYYTEGSLPFAQIVRIAAISPWAFIGFENAAHFSEEFSFPLRKIRGILIGSVLVTTLLYIFVSILSVSAYPPEFATWLDYIRNMGSLEGIKGVPAFYAAEHYLGKAGVAVLMLALFGVIVTSLFANMLALSRLLYTAGRNKEGPSKLEVLNEKEIPANTFLLIAAVSCAVPFLGRPAIGWIVDVTTLGATIIYGLISYTVYIHAKHNHAKRESMTGMIGLLLMIVFLALLLIPNLFSSDAMANESYFLFTFWALLGLLYFRQLIRRDTRNSYGQSIVVWVILLMLVLFASMMWVSKKTETLTDQAVQEIYEFHHNQPPAGSVMERDANELAFLEGQAEHINRSNTMFTIVSFALFMLSTTIMLNNFQSSRKLGQRLSDAEEKAFADQLTGVKNRMSFAQFTANLNKRIDAGTVKEFAVAVCDINDLKTVNDTLGHSTGDEYIKSACRKICQTFKHSPVFRMGGDEFTVLLEGEDYRNRQELLDEIAAWTDDHKLSPGASFSIGLSEFNPEEDESVMPVMLRADRIMYDEKKKLKESLAKEKAA